MHNPCASVLDYMVRSNKMGEVVKFIKDFSGGDQFSITTSKASIAANTHHMVVMLALVFMVCLVVAMPFVYFIAASFGRMVNSVVDGLRDIAEGEGDLTRRLKITTRDELGDLARWFNTFIENLQGILKNIAGNADQLSTGSTMSSPPSPQPLKNSPATPRKSPVMSPRLPPASKRSIPKSPRAQPR
jgi:methyl-accepting chemotaxis protein